MKRYLILLAATLFMAPLCHADDIFICHTESGKSFQSTPCDEGAATVSSRPSLALAPPGDDAGDAAAATRPVAGPLPQKMPPSEQVAIHSTRDGLPAGTSDLQVLNNRRWGKPQNITRNRDARAWHEYWDYRTGANGGTQLHFVNGVLANVEDLPQAAPRVRMASAAMEGEGR